MLEQKLQTSDFKCLQCYLSVRKTGGPSAEKYEQA